MVRNTVRVPEESLTPLPKFCRRILLGYIHLIHVLNNPKTHFLPIVLLGFALQIWSEIHIPLGYTSSVGKTLILFRNTTVRVRTTIFAKNPFRLQSQPVNQYFKIICKLSYQIRLSKEAYITDVATQGRHGGSQYTTSYSLKYLDPYISAETWRDVKVIHLG